MGVSGNLYSCLKEIKTLVMCGVEPGMALEPMQENQVSSRVVARTWGISSSYNRDGPSKLDFISDVRSPV